MSGYDMLKTKQAAALLGVSEQTMNKWRCIKKGPPYIKYTRAVRYRTEDLLEWLAQSVITPTKSK